MTTKQTQSRHKDHDVWKLFFVLYASVPLWFAVTASATETKTILFFGDSLSAGYGLEDPSIAAFPARIQKKITDAGLPWRVVNAGSAGRQAPPGCAGSIGAAAAGGHFRSRARRQRWTPRSAAGGDPRQPAGDHRPGPGEISGCDHHPGRHCRAAQHGRRLARTFAAIFPELAQKNQLPLILFLLEGVAGRPGLNQVDGIHPNERGHAIVANRVVGVEALL